MAITDSDRGSFALLIREAVEALAEREIEELEGATEGWEEWLDVPVHERRSLTLEGRRIRRRMKAAGESLDSRFRELVLSVPYSTYRLDDGRPARGLHIVEA